MSKGIVYTPLLLPVQVNPPPRRKRSSKKAIASEVRRAALQQALDFYGSQPAREYVLKPQRKTS